MKVISRLGRALLRAFENRRRKAEPELPLWAVTGVAYIMNNFDDPDELVKDFLEEVREPAARQLLALGGTPPRRYTFEADLLSGWWVGRDRAGVLHGYMPPEAYTRFVTNLQAEDLADACITIDYTNTTRH